METQDWEGRRVSSTRRLWLAGLALGMLLTLLALPATGWLVREELAMQARGSVWFGANDWFGPSDRIAAGEVRAAERNPGDYQLQLARAMMNLKDPAPLGALRE